jgi:hypothetical protein
MSNGSDLRLHVRLDCSPPTEVIHVSVDLDTNAGWYTRNKGSI